VPAARPAGRKEVPVNILIPDIPVIEKVIRSAAVYLFLLVAFRLAGKRQLGQMTAFDLVVLLVISNVVQNALIGNDNSLGGGLLGATVILLLNAVVAWLTFRYKRVERLVEQMPTVLVRHGRILRENLRRERLSLPELRAALRREGVVSLRDVRYALLEEDGHLSVIAGRPAAP
jgi:uncharacterized membrane protein YcaP (DUF421 family)